MPTADQNIVQHTPGPWVDWRRDDGAFHIGSTRHVYVCRMIGEERDPEVEANARLISAAPELLAALKTLRSHWLLTNRPETDEVARAVLTAMDSAITKAEAEGRSERCACAGRHVCEQWRGLPVTVREP